MMTCFGSAIETEGGAAGHGEPCDLHLPARPFGRERALAAEIEITIPLEARVKRDAIGHAVDRQQRLCRVDIRVIPEAKETRRSTRFVKDGEQPIAARLLNDCHRIVQLELRINAPDAVGKRRVRRTDHPGGGERNAPIDSERLLSGARPGRRTAATA